MSNFIIDGMKTLKKKKRIFCRVIDYVFMVLCYMVNVFYFFDK